MKILKVLNFFMIATLVLGSVVTNAQEKFYQLKPLAKVETNSTKAQKRVGTCWSNAGAAFLESEWMRTGKAAVDISVMDYVHNVYLKKATVFFDGDDKLRIDPAGMAFDVISLTGEYGLAPESAYMYPASEMMDSRQKEGEMDAVLRGTVNMVKQKGEGFTERWENVYNTSLLRYMGETKIEFDYQGTKYSPVSFAEYSGLNMEDYILLTSDSKLAMNKQVDLKFNENWAKHKFFNVSLDNMVDVIKKSVEDGYSVMWYGVVDETMLFDAEGMAIVPVGGMPGVVDETEEVEYVPVAEKMVTPEMRAKVIGKNISKEQDYLLIYGVNMDQKEKPYFEAKYVCESGDKVLNLSVPFARLNTIYLMINKNGLPESVKSSLKL